MNKNEFEQLVQKVSNITVNDLDNLEERTLLYGYDFERNTMHLYISDNKFCFVRYQGDNCLDMNYFQELSLDDLRKVIPPKRSYPETCDYGFVKLLNARGINVSFTTFTDRDKQNFYGKTHADFTILE